MGHRRMILPDLVLQVGSLKQRFFGRVRLIFSFSLKVSAAGVFVHSPEGLL